MNLRLTPEWCEVMEDVEKRIEAALRPVKDELLAAQARIKVLEARLPKRNDLGRPVDIVCGAPRIGVS